ncbi:tyrosine-type recombinase/integrase [Nocardia takedensis]
MTGTDLDAARRLLERMGITPEELLPTARTALSIPTFADYIPALADATPVGARRTYQNYWDRVVEVWGERRLNEPTSLELQQLVEATGRSAVVRRNHRGGRSAAEHMVSALRCLYRAADADGFVPAAASPVRGLIKPRRLPGTRRALSKHQLAQIIHVATTTGNDKELDYLLLRIHLETACRTGSALGLRPCDLDPDLCLIRLFGKGGTVHWQPVSPTLMFSLITHSLRGSDDDAQLLRYTNGRPITRRRYDHLWSRIGSLLPWVSTQQISTHWLRHVRREARDFRSEVRDRRRPAVTAAG